MKHFIVIITYTSPMTEIDEILPSHREFLQKGYDSGILLMSGPQNPRSGGIVIARSESLNNLKDFFSNDPYNLQNAVNYRFIEFNPVKHQPFLSQWCQPQNSP
jgi:uncharacterized protein YciI